MIASGKTRRLLSIYGVLIVILYDVITLLKISCSKCHNRYELASSLEYLMKMGLVPYDRSLYCEECRHED